MQGLPKEQISISEASKLLEVSIDTLRRWDKKGLVRSSRTQSNIRLFNLEDLKNIKSKNQNNYQGNRYKVLKSKKSDHSVIELFSGCGGMALGFENAGLNTKLLIENDKDCIETLAINKPKWNIVHSDIEKYNFKQYENDIDIVAGGFPCQAFSYAGKGLGFDDARGTLFFEFARCVNEVKPKIAIAENVRGLLSHDSGKTIKTMINTMKELGYKVALKLVKSQFHDVPQKRERMFLICVKNELNIDVMFPKEKNYIINLRDALKNCPESQGYNYKGRKLEIMKKVPEGGYWKDLDQDLQKEYMRGSYYLGGGKTGLARRLSFSEPSITILTSPVMKQTERGHPTENRPINIRESARIQTFPDNWQFAGSIGAQYKQIGNAVPVNLAYHIGRCVINMLDENFNSKDMETVNYYENIAEQLPLEF